MAKTLETEQVPILTLRRTMGPALATSVVVSNVIGVGIFTTPGFLARDLGDPWLILSTWLLGGGLALAGALCYAELGATLPRAGGEYAFLREAYGPLPSFLSGWASLLAGFSAPIAAASIGFTEYLSFYFPSLSTQRGDLSGSALFLPGNYVSAVVIIALSMIHYRKIQIGGRVHLGLTSFKVGIIGVFVVCGFLFGRGDTANFASIKPVAQWPDLTSSIAVAMIIIMFSYSGWNAGAYIGGEIRDPQRNLPRSLFLGTLIVVVLYLAMNAVYLYAVPLKQMSEVIQIAELASLRLFGSRVAPFLNVIFMGTILGSISAMIIVGPRVYYAMAEDGVFPKTIAKIHPRFGTPGNAIALQAVSSVSFVFLARFRRLLEFSGVVLILFAALTVASLYFIRRKNAGQPRPYSSWGYPWTMVLFLVAAAWILVGSFRSRPQALLWGLAVVASGIPFFYYWRRKNNE